MADQALFLAGAAFIVLIVAELLYFKIADRFNIIDKPNERSSHTQITIRGGGIVFVLAGLVYFVYSVFQLPVFWLAFLAISAISFADDILTLSSKVRMPVQLGAVALMIYAVLPEFNILWFAVALVLITGIINAYNFMDGINGITAGYSLVALVALYVLNVEIDFAPAALIALFIIADLVFSIFNFRTKAKCFAGDVGSVSIAFVVVYLIFSLIVKTGNPLFIMLLAVYGVDSVLTILVRLSKRENIFEAHRSHVYQWLVKPGPFSHLQVSAIYMVVQALISLTVIAVHTSSASTQWGVAVGILLALAIAYFLIKKRYKSKFGLV